MKRTISTTHASVMYLQNYKTTIDFIYLGRFQNVAKFSHIQGSYHCCLHTWCNIDEFWNFVFTYVKYVFSNMNIWINRKYYCIIKRHFNVFKFLCTLSLDSLFYEWFLPTKLKELEDKFTSWSKCKAL